MALRLSFGEFELDEARFELRHCGRAVALQPKVLDLVLYLARNRERVVTKDELLDTVWKGTVVTEGSLSQAVSLARRALADTPEEQHTLRTVRSKGLQFVAATRTTTSPDEPPRTLLASLVARPPAPVIATMDETAEDRAHPVTAGTVGPCLIAALHCEAPGLGGAAWTLDDVDEVEIGRGSERRSGRTKATTCVLTIALPGRLLSRKHARITRTPHGWLVVDEGSRNGTFVGGLRIDKHLLAPGDVIDCGRTLFRFTTERHRTESMTLSDTSREGTILGTVTPALMDLEHDLRRLAASDVPVLLLGESGAGKTHVAEEVHHLSGRSRWVRFGVDPDPDDAQARVTLLVDTLEDAPLARLERLLEGSPGVRVIATSRLDRAAVLERLSSALRTRLVGYSCELPPLRRRIGDMGVLVARLLGDAAGALEIDIEAGRALLQYDWPGNVRELGHRLQVASSLAHGGPLRVAHLLPES